MNDNDNDDDSAVYDNEVDGDDNDNKDDLLID